MPDALKPGTTLYAAELVDGRVVVEEGISDEDYVGPGEVGSVVTDATGRRRAIDGWHPTPEDAKAGLVERLRVEMDEAAEARYKADLLSSRARRLYRAAREQVEGPG